MTEFQTRCYQEALNYLQTYLNDTEFRGVYMNGLSDKFGVSQYTLQTLVSLGYLEKRNAKPTQYRRVRPLLTDISIISLIGKIKAKASEPSQNIRATRKQTIIRYNAALKNIQDMFSKSNVATIHTGEFSLAHSVSGSFIVCCVELGIIDRFSQAPDTTYTYRPGRNLNTLTGSDVLAAVTRRTKQNKGTVELHDAEPEPTPETPAIEMIFKESPKPNPPLPEHTPVPEVSVVTQSLSMLIQGQPMSATITISGCGDFGGAVGILRPLLLSLGYKIQEIG